MQILIGPQCNVTKNKYQCLFVPKLCAQYGRFIKQCSTVIWEEGGVIINAALIIGRYLSQVYLQVADTQTGGNSSSQLLTQVLLIYLEMVFGSGAFHSEVMALLNLSLINSAAFSVSHHHPSCLIHHDAQQ